MGRGPDFSNPYKDNENLYELANMIGVDSDDYWEEDTGSQGAFDRKRFIDDIEAGYSNDYSTRRALEAANLAGEEGIPEKIGSIEDAYAAHKWMKEQHEGGGKYSSDSDRANIAWDWVQKDRDNFTNDLNGQMESLIDDALGEQNPINEEDSNKEVELSPRLATSRGRLETAANDPGSLYSSGLYSDNDGDYENNRFEANNQNVDKTDDQKDGARNFFDNSKVTLATGMNLQEDIFNNLSNAASTVTNIYGR